MAELANAPQSGAKNPAASRGKKASIRVDLTAMVDLAFLLITFFILTTTLQKPKAMTLIMPDKPDHPAPGAPYPASRTMTVLLGSHNKVAWYMGLPENPSAGPVTTSFGRNGIRQALMEQTERLKAQQGKSLLVVIKPSNRSVYGNVVNMMDELSIIDNQSHAIADITPSEVDQLKRKGIY